MSIKFNVLSCTTATGNHILAIKQSAWHKVIDETGAAVEHYSFDPWGRRRNPKDLTYNNVPTAYQFDRGYTGQSLPCLCGEMLDAFGLINMNGRVYDPLMARFLSPDNYVQLPDNTQGFNRYSYCLNNPLKYTDPSGEFWHLVIGAVVGGLGNWLAYGAEFSLKGLGYFGIGAVAGASGAGIGARISAAIAGAGTAGVSGATFAAGFMGTSSGMATGVASGIVSGVGGGFSSGFVSGFGNKLYDGGTFKASFSKGLDYGWKGAVMGGIAGGVMGGLDAIDSRQNFWTGAPKQQITIQKTQQGETISKSRADCDFAEKHYPKSLKNFSTKITPQDVTRSNDGAFYNVTIKFSERGVYDGFNFMAKDVSAKIINGFENTAFNVTYSNGTFCSSYIFDPTDQGIILYGWRWDSTPINSIRSLFYPKF